jgi:hypothetical protein
MRLTEGYTVLNTGCMKPYMIVITLSCLSGRPVYAQAFADQGAGFVSKRA